MRELKLGLRIRTRGRWIYPPQNAMFLDDYRRRVSPLLTSLGYTSDEIEEDVKSMGDEVNTRAPVVTFDDSGDDGESVDELMKRLASAGLH